MQHLPEERADPLGEERLSPVPGVVHRYPDRVLLKLTHVCPVYCRFCFRREVVGPGRAAGAVGGSPRRGRSAYIAGDPGIWEVILTGGDPLMLSARRVAEVTRRLSAIDTVKVLRWHTRVPVADPGRVTEGLAAALRSPARAVYLVVHANHPRELTPAVRASLGRLSDAGIALLSQTVLLRGVNDDAGTLAALMRALVECRVKPYYLHHPDLAPGTSHFRLSIAEGQALMRQLRGRLSGLAQPTYVLDIPGGFGKVPVGPTYMTMAAKMAAAASPIPPVRCTSIRSGGEAACTRCMPRRRGCARPCRGKPLADPGGMLLSERRSPESGALGARLP